MAAPQSPGAAGAARRRGNPQISSSFSLIFARVSPTMLFAWSRNVAV
jgi:hypothetical protein